MRTLALVYAGTLALLLVAPVLPAVGGAGDLNTALSAGPAMLALGACVLATLPGRDFVPGLALTVLAAGLLGGALTVAESLALADLAKALFAAALGMLGARLLADPVVVVAVPLFVAALDVASVVAGPASTILRGSSEAGDFLTVYLPAWGGGRAAVLGVADLVFLAFFASSAWRFRLRRRATAAAMLAAFPLALAIELAADRVVPVIPLLAAGLLLPNLDLLRPLLAGRGRA
jgi:hypothetical protein